MRQVVADADSDAGHVVEPAGGQFVQVAGIFFLFFFLFFQYFSPPEDAAASINMKRAMNAAVYAQGDVYWRVPYRW